MKEQLVTFETAKLAKEKGFNVPSYVYQNDGIIPDITNIEKDIIEDARHKYTYAPTQSLLQKWLREKHGMHVTPDLSVYNISGYYVRIDSYNRIKQEVKCHFHSEDKGLLFDTYEEALEKGLIEALNKI